MSPGIEIVELGETDRTLGLNINRDLPESLSHENMDCLTPVPNDINMSGFEAINNFSTTRNGSRNRYISAQVYPLPIGIKVAGIAHVSPQEI